MSARERQDRRDRLLALIDAFAGRSVMIVGDVVLDEYLIGTTSRLSREAPIPVLEFVRREVIPGGAANPAANVVGLGGRALQVGVVGDDPNGKLLCDLLAARGIEPGGVVTDAGRCTTTKTRLMAQMGLRFPQQVARIDRIDREPVNGGVAEAVIAQMRALAPQAEAITLSDYLAGLLTAPIVQAARDLGKLITADAQGDLDKYAGFDLVKCNADEARRYIRRELSSDADFAESGTTIAAHLGLRGAMLITRGPDGITLARPDGEALHIPAPTIEDVYDTVGAGDTVLAVVTLALLAGATYGEAATLANLAAGIVIRKVGNYAPSPAELKAAVLHETP